MNRLSKYFVLKLIQSGYIKEDKKEWCQYVILHMIEKLLSYGMLIILSIYFKMLFPTLLFMVGFLSLRSWTGGFHMSTFKKCLLSTGIMYVFMVKVLFPYFESNLTLLYILLLISIGYTYIVGAVNHPNMDWDKTEYAESKRSSRILVILEGIVIISFAQLNADNACIIFSALGVIQCAIFLFLAKIFRQQVKADIKI